MKKICIATGSRAEFGLLHPLMKAIEMDEGMNLQILVSGMHLSPEFGNTYTSIEQEFVIDEKIDMLLSGDTDAAIIKSMGVGLIGFADAFVRMQPDFVVVLGDRFETFCFTLAAFMHKIPVIHLHGGELTEGASDDSLRHAITKLSYFHFTSTEIYRKRVIQLGEEKERVFNVGAIGLDNIKKLQLYDIGELEASLGIKLWEKFALVTYHPVTLDNKSSKKDFEALLSVLEKQRDFQVIFTLPNADADHRIILDLIVEFTQKHPERAFYFTSLGQIRYLSAIKHCYLVIGNSSSGIIEAPSFGIPTINIGDRQKGRIMPATVIHASPDENSIEIAIKKAADSGFRQQCKKAINPYGDGNTTERIIEVLKKINRTASIKKTFFDLP